MRGTEKQIKWAEDITAHLLDTYRTAKPMLPTNEQPLVDVLISKLDAIQYADEIIDAYKDVQWTGDPLVDLHNVIFATTLLCPEARAKFLPQL